jgi:hypothetical protein
MKDHIDVTGVGMNKLARIALEISIRCSLNCTLEEFGITEQNVLDRFNEVDGAMLGDFLVYIDYAHVGAIKTPVAVKVKVMMVDDLSCSVDIRDHVPHMLTRDGLWQDHTPEQQAELLERLGIPERNPLMA